MSLQATGLNLFKISLDVEQEKMEKMVQAAIANALGESDSSTDLSNVLSDQANPVKDSRTLQKSISNIGKSLREKFGLAIGTQTSSVSNNGLVKSEQCEIKLEENSRMIEELLSQGVGFKGQGELISKLEKENKTVQDELKNIISAKKDLESKNSELSVKIEQYEIAIATGTSALESLKSEKSDIQSRLDSALESTVDSSGSELAKDLQERLEGANARTSALSVELEASNASLTGSKSELIELKESESAMKEAIESSMRQVESISSELESAKASLIEATEAKLVAESQAQISEQSLEAIKAASESAKVIAETEAKRAEDAMESAKRALAVCEQNFQQYKENGSSTNSEQLEKALSDLKDAEDEVRVSKEAKESAEVNAKNAEDAKNSAEETAKRAEEAKVAAEEEAKRAEEAKVSAEEEAKRAEEAKVAAEAAKASAVSALETCKKEFQNYKKESTSENAAKLEKALSDLKKAEDALKLTIIPSLNGDSGDVLSENEATMEPEDETKLTVDVNAEVVEDESITSRPTTPREINTIHSVMAKADNQRSPKVNDIVKGYTRQNVGRATRSVNQWYISSASFQDEGSIEKETMEKSDSFKTVIAAVGNAVLNGGDPEVENEFDAIFRNGKTGSLGLKRGDEEVNVDVKDVKFWASFSASNIKAVNRKNLKSAVQIGELFLRFMDEFGLSVGDTVYMGSKRSVDPNSSASLEGMFMWLKNKASPNTDAYKH
jgi:myosin heavy subunit